MSQFTQQCTAVSLRGAAVFCFAGTLFVAPFIGVILWCTSCSEVCSAPTADPFAEKFRKLRLNMVEKDLIKEGITNERVLEAMRDVPRHLFIPKAVQDNAYVDTALPIGEQQTISSPFIVAYMTETLDPQPTDRVLEIGTGSGYQAAVLSPLVQDVYTIEIVEPLGRRAENLLNELKYKNVHVRVGDGFLGWPEVAPFDKIIVTCSPEDVPKPLVEQLKEGGKLIIPLGERYQQVFYLFEKREAELVKTKLVPTLFVPMTGASENARQKKPDPAHPVLVNGDFEIDEDEDGLPDNWYYARQVKLTNSEPRSGEKRLEFHCEDPGRGCQILQGLGFDGSKIGRLEVKIDVSGTRLKQGPRQFEKPSVVIHCYDSLRRPVGEEIVGPWHGSFDWRTIRKSVAIPPATREIIVRVGLNGGTGTLGVDNMQLTPKPR